MNNPTPDKIFTIRLTRMQLRVLHDAISSRYTNLSKTYHSSKVLSEEQVNARMKALDDIDFKICNHLSYVPQKKRMNNDK
jgi:hypothetical protein